MKKQDLIICFKEFLNKNYLNQISNFQQPRNPFMFLFSILVRQYSFFYLSDPSHTLSLIFYRASQQFGPTTHSAHRPNFLWSSLTSRRDASRRLRPPWPPHHCSLCCPPPTPWGRLASPLFPSKNGRTQSPPLPRFHLL
jgi:hypothetical protein